MKKLDLGATVEFEVKVGGEFYVISEPSVRQISDHKDGISDGNTDAFLDLLVDIGMPRDVCDGLSVSQLRKLADGLVGDLAEKK